MLNVTTARNAWPALQYGRDDLEEAIRCSTEALTRASLR